MKKQNAALETIEIGRTHYSQTPEYSHGWRLAESYRSLPYEKLVNWMQQRTNEIYPDHGPERAGFITGYATFIRTQTAVEASLEAIHALGKSLTVESIIQQMGPASEFSSAEEVTLYMHDVYGWSSPA